jgi:hypothetical protein
MKALEAVILNLYQIPDGEGIYGDLSIKSIAPRGGTSGDRAWRIRMIFLSMFFHGKPVKTRFNRAAKRSLLESLFGGRAALRRILWASGSTGWLRQPEKVRPSKRLFHRPDSRLNPGLFLRLHIETGTHRGMARMPF